MTFNCLTPFADSFVNSDRFELVIYFHTNEKDDELTVFTVNLSDNSDLRRFEAVFISKLTFQFSSFFIQYFDEQRQLCANNADSFAHTTLILCKQRSHLVRTSTFYGQHLVCTNNVNFVQTTPLCANKVHTCMNSADLPKKIREIID